ncbi:Hsp20 family protein [Clostridium thermobutyricum]|uniref:18 kDa heat shock protein n=1 Tax=Clostridium thermobutyricum DSM 4928 TaxID=1121339 RepID=A0A1V4SUC8_9CLOT|nr:Hsp20 family protein [Clostridium thermobutyricum]OPX47055.1 18 kDa heat shock protein [Clostridium thermobutyricum DSM 4928]
MNNNQGIGFFKNLYLDMLNEINSSDFFEEEVDQGDIEISIKNEEDKYLIQGFFPGIQKKDIKIDYKDDYLFMKIKRKKVLSNRGNMSVMMISQFNDYKKKFYIPDNDISNLKVSFKNHKLNLEIPKIIYNFKEENPVIIDVLDYEEE